MENQFVKVMSKYDDQKLLSIISKERYDYSEEGVEAAKIVLSERGVFFEDKEPPRPIKQAKPIEKEKTPFQKGVEERARLKMYVLGALGPLFILYGLSNSSAYLKVGFIATLISWPLIYWQHQIDKKKSS